MYDSATTNGVTRSLWYSTLPPDDLVALEGDGPCRHGADGPLRVDVAIVGAGIAGLSVAYQLCKAGRSVAVFDKGLVGSGETGRTTAHLASALDDRYAVLERLHGQAGAKLAAASHVAAIADIQQIVEAEQIACAFTRVPGYLISTHQGAAAERELERELRAAERAGIEVQLVRDEADSPWAPELHLRFPRQAQFQPLAYLAGLARAIRRMGGKIYTRTRVHGVHTSGSPLSLQLEAATVVARDIVIATNSPVVDRFAMHTKQAAYRSYVVAMQLSAPLPPALLWDSGDPYHYVRLAEANDVLIVGGEDHKVGQARDPKHAWSELEAWTRARFAGAMNVRSRWSGQILEPADGMAFIGRNPGISQHVFIATGDSGNGMTHGALAGLLLRDLILERPQAWTQLYDPTRLVKRGALKEFVRENVNVAVHAATTYIGAPSEHTDIQPGTGRVVRHGLQRLAVYVATDGQVHTCSAVCPHLGCVVQWNDAETSWDCPCHGSRFDPYGGVLTGPALRDLTPASPRHHETRNHPMQQKLLHHLSHELWQTEVSASQHCRREAERLGDTPPARALLSAAEHADEVLGELPKLAFGGPIAHSTVGMAVGKLFSVMRDSVADKLLTSERSYRGTMLGLRHGVDLVKLMRASVQQTGNVALQAFFDGWLARRLPIMEQIEAQLQWFAQHPQPAMEPARGLFSRRSLKSFIHSA